MFVSSVKRDLNHLHNSHVYASPKQKVARKWLILVCMVPQIICSMLPFRVFLPLAIHKTKQNKNKILSRKIISPQHRISYLCFSTQNLC